MMSKVVTVLVVLCALQGIHGKAMNPFWGMNPMMNPMMNPFFSPLNDPTMDPEVRAIVTEIQMRLSQVSSISKSTIGMSVGLASKNIGMMTSVAKSNIKLLVNNVQNNPNATKDCVSLNKPVIDQLNTESKNQLSFCSKTSQVQLKSMNQVHKDLSLQASTLTSELNLAVSQCRLEHPLPTDAALVTECVTTKAEAIKEKIAALESQVMQTVSAVDSGISSIVDQTSQCTQQLEQQVKDQAQSINGQLETCSATYAVL